MQGVSYKPYFTEAYYRKEVPIWESYAPGLFAEPGSDWVMLIRGIGLALAFGIFGALIVLFFVRRSVAPQSHR